MSDMYGVSREGYKRIFLILFVLRVFQESQGFRVSGISESL